MDQSTNESQELPGGIKVKKEAERMGDYLVSNVSNNTEVVESIKKLGENRLKFGLALVYLKSRAENSESGKEKRDILSIVKLLGERESYMAAHPGLNAEEKSNTGPVPMTAARNSNS